MSDTPYTLHGGAPAPEAAPVLDAERLEVYHVAVEFQAVAAQLALRCDSVTRDQLRRASLSVVLCIAEGAGQNSRAQKRRLYGIARGSAMECAALLDVLRVRAAAEPSECLRGRALVIRVVQMLTRLDQAMR